MGLWSVFYADTDDMTVVRFLFVSIRDKFMDASTRTTLHSCGSISIIYSALSLSFLPRQSLLLCPIMAWYSSVLPDPACVRRP